MVKVKMVCPVGIRERISKVRELEHFCKLYINAYIQQLEGRKKCSNSQMTVEKMINRLWDRLLDVQHLTLMQEGRVPLEIDESVYED